MKSLHARRCSSIGSTVAVILYLLPALALSETPPIPIPPESCSAAWERNTPEDYLFNFNEDRDYASFQKRMKEIGIDRKNCHKTWTVFVYMAATEDLVPFAYANLLEMEAPSLKIENPDQRTGSSIRTDVVVQLNLATEPQFQRLHLFESPKDQPLILKREAIPQFSREQIHSPIVSSLPRSFPTSERKQLEDFLKWGIQEYPSEHYFIIIWGHGEGWTATNGSLEAKSISPSRDHSGRFGGLAFNEPLELLEGHPQEYSEKTHPQPYLDLPDLRLVLKNMKDWSGGPVDLFVSDACLMQTVEDATELAQYTLYTYGSEDVQSYWGIDYDSLLCRLNSGNFGTAHTEAGDLYPGEPYLLAYILPPLHEKAYRPNEGLLALADPQNYKDLTACSVSSKHLRTSLVPALDALGWALVAFIDEEKTRWIDLKGLVQQGPFFIGGTQDLGAFIQGLSLLVAAEIKAHPQKATLATLKLQQAVQKTYQSLNYAVVNSVLGAKYPQFNPKKEFGPRGLSIWLPETDEEFHNRIADFSQSIFYGGHDRSARQGDANTSDACQAPGWVCWMKKIYP